NHVFIGTAYNGGKILISEESELGRGSRGNLSTTNDALAYLENQMQLQVFSAKEAVKKLSFAAQDIDLRKTMNNIFISYSHKDGEEIAEFFHERLTGCGYDVWKDSHNLQVGKKFPRAISDAVEKTNDFIVLLTKAALQSDWVDNEINMAMTAGCNV